MKDIELYNDHDLLIKVSEGDENAFKTLFYRYKNKIYSFSLFVTKSEYLAEEITQDVFMRIWRHKSELNKIENLGSYLKTIAKNCALNHVYRIARERMMLEKIMKETPVHENETENHVLLSEYERMMDSAINSLPPQQRKVYILHRYKGLKHRQIAEMMHLSIYTVKEYMKSAQKSIDPIIRNILKQGSY